MNMDIKDFCNIFMTVDDVNLLMNKLTISQTIDVIYYIFQHHKEMPYGDELFKLAKYKIEHIKI